MSWWARFQEERDGIPWQLRASQRRFRNKMRDQQRFYEWRWLGEYNCGIRVLPDPVHSPHFLLNRWRETEGRVYRHKCDMRHFHVTPTEYQILRESGF